MNKEPFIFKRFECFYFKSKKAYKNIFKIIRNYWHHIKYNLYNIVHKLSNF